MTNQDKTVRIWVWIIGIAVLFMAIPQGGWYLKILNDSALHIQSTLDKERKKVCSSMPCYEY